MFLLEVSCHCSLQATKESFITCISMKLKLAIANILKLSIVVLILPIYVDILIRTQNYIYSNFIYI